MEATVNTTAVSNENKANQSALYHYTAGWEKIAAILISGVISKDFKLHDELSPAVWFSTNPLWEGSAMKVCGGVEQHAEKLGAFRIKIKSNVPVSTWDDFIGENEKHKKYCSYLETIGRKLGGDPEEWYYSDDHISIYSDSVESIGIYQNGKWHDMSVENFWKKFSDNIREVKIEPVSLAMIVKLQKTGAVLSPMFEKTLKHIEETGKTKKILPIAIGKMIHCLAVNN